MRNSIKKALFQFSRIFTWSVQDDIKLIRKSVAAQNKLLVDDYLESHLFNNPAYADPKKLNRYEYQVYSQNGEDGIIQEIFKRIGTTNKFFVEFGVDDRIECNTLLLLLQDWRGAWLDGNPQQIKEMNKKFAYLIEEKKLAIKEAFISAENIEDLFASLDVPKDLDLLSIDIDGNDYWVWKAITHYKPRVVVIEYNAMFRPPIEFAVKYDAHKRYYTQSHFGASLKSLEKLGASKGYRLVGCNFIGANAFFVRGDLVADKFLEPFTAENHHEPPRYFAISQVGHKRNFDRFEIPNPGK